MKELVSTRRTTDMHGQFQNPPYGIKFYHTPHFPQTGQDMLVTTRKVSAVRVWINVEPGRSELKNTVGSKPKCEYRETINKG